MRCLGYALHNGHLPDRGILERALYIEEVDYWHGLSAPTRQLLSNRIDRTEDELAEDLRCSLAESTLDDDD